MNELKVIISKITDPYENLALEKFLLEGVSSGTVILYLWQNERSVVCGRNQNIWKECALERLLKDGGHPARRLSGGGAVYHDLGNLNFTFIACEKDYDLSRQMDVIQKAALSFGIETERSGRNDITANGAKFSGNAFYKMNPGRSADKDARCYHHGTLMLSVDRSVLSDYLNVDKEKYESKGVDSVKSRVCNLADLNGDINKDSMTSAMINAFEEVYKAGAAVYEYYGIFEDRVTALEDAPDISGEKNAKRRDILKLSEKERIYLKETADFFSSDEWLYKNNIRFNVRFSKRFSFGDLDLRLYVEKGVIRKTALYSDAMDEQKILEAEERIRALEGSAYSTGALKKALDIEEANEFF